MIWRCLAGFFLTVFSLQSIAADDTKFRALNVGVLDQIVIPAYRNLSQSAEALNRQAIESCEQPSDASLNLLRDRFTTYVDSWMAIELFRQGPVVYLYRQSRIQYWPDKHDVVSRQLRRLLAEQNVTELAHSEFTHLSAGVQGITALEVLLYDNKAAELFTNTTKSGQFRCQFIQAISHNQQVMLQGLNDDWQREDRGYRNLLLAENKGSQEPRDTGIDILRLVYGEILAIKLHKLGRPLDNSIDTAKPQRTELWRSGLSQLNIQRNLKTVAQFFEPTSPVNNFYNLENSGDNQTEPNQSIAEKISQLIAQSKQQLAQLSLPIDESVSDEFNRQILLSVVDSLELVAQQIENYTNVVYQSPLGFNSFDGD
ncbi:MAG: putative lipoprotein [Gammaproteobacteria bacterium]|jgi:predicted lipoprotein